ncbi:MAG: sodium/proton-translocating pyrophosphatase [Candidatus Bathyarchaeales archaeon]
MLVVAYLAWSLLKEPAGTPEMDKIAGYIEEGAEAFIKRRYKTIGYFVVLTLVPIVLFFQDVRLAITFLFGATVSLLAAYIGLRVAVKSNVRTANAARTSSTKVSTLPQKTHSNRWLHQHCSPS